MSNSYFQFKQFIIHQDQCAMKVTTDSCLFGAWIAENVRCSEFDVHPSVFKNVLDIGTGTGLLSLMLAQKNPALEIDAIEIDEGASLQAKENFENSPWKNRISLIHADVKHFDFIKKYDVIIANPPFYDNELKGKELKKNLAHHDTGLLLPALMDTIKKNLEPGGSFYLLLPFKRNEEVKKIVRDNELSVQQITLSRQSINHEYFRMMISGMHKNNRPVETMINEISIKDGNNFYTTEFIRLLKDYYLHL
jgi:tRNA1Val (adenine37-N6)-methyltransferase